MLKKFNNNNIPKIYNLWKKNGFLILKEYSIIFFFGIFRLKTKGVMGKKLPSIIYFGTDFSFTSWLSTLLAKRNATLFIFL